MSILPKVGNIDLNTVTEPGFYYFDGATGDNRPEVNTGAFSLLVKNTGGWGGNGRSQVYTAYDSGNTYTRVFSGNSGDPWTKWCKVATAIPPQEYNLQLQNGWTTLDGHRNGYSIDQFGIVRGWLGLTRDAVPENGSVVCILPEGFRPSSYCSAAVTLWIGPTVYPANILVSNSGEMILSNTIKDSIGNVNLHGFFMLQ